MTHRCHAVGHQVATRPAMLMCPPHWRMVPAANKRAVWATYRHGQEARMDPSPDYLRAAMEAVIAVALKEGYTVEAIKTAPEVLLYWRMLQAMGEAPGDDEGPAQLKLEVDG